MSVKNMIKNISKRGLAMLLAVITFMTSMPIVPAFAAGDATVTGLTNPFTPGTKFTIDGKEYTSQSYRIPNMETLSDGTILASADIRWNTTYDGGGLDTIVARSTDNGKTWTYNVANYLGDNGNVYNANSTTFIDPCLLVAGDGYTTYMLVDLYAYGVALNGNGNQTKPAYDSGFNSKGYLALFKDGENATAGAGYYLKDGKIYKNSDDSVVEGYSVDGKFNLTYTDKNKNINTINLFRANSPFKVTKTQYLYLTKSTDGGKTWSDPTLLNLKTRENALLASPGNAITTQNGVMVFPVYSYSYSGNTETQHAGLIYSADGGQTWERSADFTGLSFTSEASIVELQNGKLRVFFRNKTAELRYADFDMATKTWGSAVDTNIAVNSNTQLGAISYSKTVNGKQVILVTAPTGPTGQNGSDSNDGSVRTNGKLFVFTVNNDENRTMTLEKSLKLYDNAATKALSNVNNKPHYTKAQGFFAYSTLTETADGGIVVLYEDNQFGWGASGDNGDGTYNPANVDTYFTIGIDGFKASDLGLTFDKPETVITDVNGNKITSATLSTTEKVEMIAVAPFKTADVDYQWQIEYETGKWFDITGETDKNIAVSFGMTVSLANKNNQVNIRCMTAAGSQVLYSKPVTVTVQMPNPSQPEEPGVIVTDSFTSSTGNVVTVSVAGNLPNNASIDLAETDSVGVELKAGETVAAALDIAVKNSDGTAWQPEAGESVTVTLKAADVGLEKGDQFVIYHVHENQVGIVGAYTVKGDTITFTVDGFSKFVFARAQQVIFTEDLKLDVGKFATLQWDIFAVVDDPDENDQQTVTPGVDYEGDLEFIITDAYVTSTYPYDMFYKVSVNKGTVLSDIFEKYPWVCQGNQTYTDDWLTLLIEENKVGVTVDGETVDEVRISTTNPVTMSAVTDFTTADVSYRWQICYDTENNLWVDISGQTGKQITLTAGMVASLMDSNNQALVRCAATAGSRTVVSDVITVVMPGGMGNEGSKVAIQIDGVSTDSVEIMDEEKQNFGATLSVNTNMQGELTYSWQVLANPTTGRWKKLADTETIQPTFDANAGGTYIGDSNYIQYVSQTMSTVTLRVQVSDGITTLTDVFSININHDSVAQLPDFYSCMMYSPAVYQARLAAATPAVSSYSLKGRAMPAAETTTTYQVSILYWDETGEKTVANAYQSTVSPTTELRNTISFPKVTGYLPHVLKDGKLVRQDSYTFDGTPFTEDFILNVYYLPGAVDFKVNVYWQNTDNDQYTLVESVTLQALTGTKPEDLDVFEEDFIYEGFYQSKLSSEDAFIAADGSTVFNLYFDRIYYLMKFDLDDGYGTMPIYARHGVELEITPPTKAGYTFVGWDQTSGKAADGNVLNDGIADTMYTHMPIGNTAFKAIWDPVDNAKVTIVYWGENANDEKYSYMGVSQELYVKPGTQLTYGSDQLICTLTPHTHGNGCTYDCGITPHAHSLTNTPSCYVLDCNETSHNHTTSGCSLKCSHTHTTSCYNLNNDYRQLRETTKPTATLTNQGNGIYTYTTGNYGNRVTHYYVEIDGKWYTGWSTYYREYRDTTTITISCTHGHTDVCYSCGKNEGTHVHSVEQGCYDVVCDIDEHTHTADCYSCVAHKHNDDCYLKENRFDTDLWTYVKSDNVTVSADGTTVMNVYYDRTTFTLHFRKENSNVDDYGTVTAKWGANVEDEFNAACDKAGYKSWSEKKDGSNPWTNRIDIMPQEDRTYYRYSGRHVYTWVMTYYIESLDGGDEVAFTIELYRNNTTSVSDEEYIEMEGFTINKNRSTKTGSSTNGAKFYYDRNSYTLEFNNGETAVKRVDVLYQDDLGKYAFTPTAPSIYEPGSVQFAGWYQNPECTGEEVVLDETTMPSTNKILYAKWVPVKHNVTVYRYKDDNGLHDLLCNHTDAAIGSMEALGSVPHGDLLNKHYIPEKPTHGNYTFVTWAYYDEQKGEDVAIDINSFVVTKDVEIYAIWNSNVQIPYTIKYVDAATGKEVAPTDTGKYYAGATYTFKAKTGSQMNSGYETGWFPHTDSHSIYFDAEAQSYVFEFKYTKAKDVPYTVYYVTKNENNTGLGSVTVDGETYYNLVASKTATTNHAMVTENFVVINGYMPDKYQETLILNATDTSKNVIVFVYTVNNTQAYYKVTHYIEMLDGDPYVYDTDSYIGTIDTRYDEGAKDIPGFTYDRTEYKDSKGNTVSSNKNGAVLTADGLEINLYYTRNEYKYTVLYVDKYEGTVLYKDESGKGKYGATVSHTAPEYFDETNVLQPNIWKREGAATLSTVIQVDEKNNVITFYYVEREVDIKYQVLGGENGGGMVNPSKETVKVFNETAQGSTAEPKYGYRFVKWVDANNKTVGENLNFVPAKVNGVNVEATYTAVFEEVDVTILYKVKGEIGGTVSRGSETVLVHSGVAAGSTAKAETGYTFVRWEDASGNQVSTDLHFVPKKENNVNVGKTYYAVFTENNVTINYAVKGGVGGSVTPGSETVKVHTGTAQGSTATAGDGYTFSHWEDASENVVGTNLHFVPEKVNNMNVSATYYAVFTENSATINYVAVGPQDSGSVAPTSEVVKVHSGVAQGSTATASSNVYKFVGWYLDQDCTKPVPAEWVKDGKIVPQKEADEMWQTATYYAKFEYNLTSLTIDKAYAANYGNIDEFQTFIFDVVELDAQGKETANKLTVTVHGDGQVVIDGLTVGKSYKVTEQTGWSWRYKNTDVSHTNGIITLRADASANKVTFTNTRTETQWLDGNSWCNNIFK